MYKGRYLLYLAGPITGTTYGECTDWRQYVQDNLPEEIIGMSPLRAKQYLKNENDIADQYQDDLSVLSTQRGIFARDTWDATRCDGVFVNLLGTTRRVSIGTVMEIAWAWHARNPIILVMEIGNIHDHSMLREACPFRVDTIEEGINVAKALFLPTNH